MVPRPEALDVYLRLVTFPWVSCMLYSVCWKDIRPINPQTFQQTLRAPDPLSLCFSSSVLPQSSVAWARDGDCLEEVSRKSKRLICLEHSKTFKFLLHLMCPLVGWYELETSDVTHTWNSSHPVPFGNKDWMQQDLSRKSANTTAKESHLSSQSRWPFSYLSILSTNRRKFMFHTSAWFWINSQCVRSLTTSSLKTRSI